MCGFPNPASANAHACMAFVQSYGEFCLRETQTMKRSENMKIKKRWFLAMAVAVLLLSVGAAIPNTNRSSSEIRWDIVSINPPTNFNLNPGGIASARAENCSKITFTGSGTFVAPAGGGGTSSGVTGGGTWETFSGSSPCPCNSTATGTTTGSGTYEVTGLVRWEDAPGSLPGPVIDNIGVKAD